MVRNFIYRMFMGKKTNLQKAVALTEIEIEYSSQVTKKDLADADLRRIEVTSIVEEIIRSRSRRGQRRSKKLEDIKNAA